MSESDTLNSPDASTDASADAPDTNAAVHDSAGQPASQLAPRWWSLRVPPSPRRLRLVATIGSIVVLLALLPAVLNASHN